MKKTSITFTIGVDTNGGTDVTITCDSDMLADDKGKTFVGNIYLKTLEIVTDMIVTKNMTAVNNDDLGDTDD